MAEDRGWSRTLLAVVVGWLCPGAGHAVVGRWKRGLAFGALLWVAFFFGMAHDARVSLKDGKQPLLSGLQVVANLGMGPADLISRYAVYGEVTYSMTGGADPVRTVETFRARERSAVSIYGTAYVWTAGPMNFLLLFDVWDIGRGRRQRA